MADAAGNHYGPFDVDVNPDAEDYNEASYYRFHRKSGVLSGGGITFDGRTYHLAPIEARVRGSFFYRETELVGTSDATVSGNPRRDLLVLRRTLTAGTGESATPGKTVPVLLKGTPAVTPVNPAFDAAKDELLWSWQVPGSGGSTITNVIDHRGPVGTRSAKNSDFFTGTTIPNSNTEYTVGVLRIPSDYGDRRYIAEMTTMLLVSADANTQIAARLRLDSDTGTPIGPDVTRSGKLPAGENIPLDLNFESDVLTGAHVINVTARRIFGTGAWTVPQFGNHFSARIRFVDGS